MVRVVSVNLGRQQSPLMLLRQADEAHTIPVICPFMDRGMLRLLIQTQVPSILCPAVPVAPKRLL